MPRTPATYSGRHIPNPDALRLAARVKMDTLGMSQSALAKELRITDAALTSLFRHNRTPELSAVWALMWWLNVGVREVSMDLIIPGGQPETETDPSPVSEAA